MKLMNNDDIGLNTNCKLACTNSKVKNYFNLLNAMESKFLINVPIQFSD